MHKMKFNNFNKNTFLFLGFFIILLLLLDVTLACIDLYPMKKKINTKIRQQHPYYHHALRPSMFHAFEEVGLDVSYTLITNSLGFKDSSMRQVPLKVNKRRLLFIGDSFTEGILLPYALTFTGQIANHRPDLDILNAGITSYSPLIYFLKVEYLINEVGLQFDELYVFIDISDIQDEYVYNEVERFAPALEASCFRDFLLKIDRFINNHSYIYNLLKQLMYHLSEQRRIYGSRAVWTFNQHLYDKYDLNIREEDVKKWAEKGIVHAQDNMQKLVNLCKNNNIQITIVIYPWNSQIYAKDIPSKQQIIWRSFAEKNNIGFLDLFPIFINDESPQTILGRYFFHENDHWNACGHALVANKVLEFMKKNEKNIH